MFADRPADARPATDHPYEVTEAFTQATTIALEELARTFLVSGEPYISSSDQAVGWVNAEITLRRTVEGLLVLAFPRSVLDLLAGRYLIDDPPLTPELIDDAAGEFANVIAGLAKTMLKGTPYHFTLSTPKVGLASTSTDCEFLVLPFDSDAGQFNVLISLKKSAE